MLIVVAGDQDGLVRKLRIQGIGDEFRDSSFQPPGVERSVAKVGAGRDSVKRHAP